MSSEIHSAKIRALAALVTYCLIASAWLLAGAEKEFVVEKDLQMLAISPDHTRAYVFDSDQKRPQGNAEIWDLEHARKVCEIPFSTSLSSRNIYRYSRDGRWLAIGVDFNVWVIADATTGDLHCTLEGAWKVRENPFSPDGDLIVGELHDENCAVFSASTGKLLYKIDAPDLMDKISFWNDGKTLFYKTRWWNKGRTSRDRIGLIDISTGKKRFEAESINPEFGVSENLHFAAGDYRVGNSGDYSMFYDLEQGSSTPLMSGGTRASGVGGRYVITNNGKWILIRLNQITGVFNAHTGQSQNNLMGEIKEIYNERSRLITHYSGTGENGIHETVYELYDLNTLQHIRTIPSKALSQAIKEHCNENFDYRRNLEYSGAEGNIDFLTALPWGENSVAIAGRKEIRLLNKTSAELVQKLPTFVGATNAPVGYPGFMHVYGFYGTGRLIAIGHQKLRIYKETASEHRDN